MKLSQIKVNPENPRVIKDLKFKKLCDSLKAAPWMMKLRPIIIDEKGMIQGGNMRYKALIHLGYTEIPDEWVKQGSDLTPEQWKEFVIKDNLSYGEWDWDAVANGWDIEQLTEWGMDLPIEELEQDAIEKVKEDDYEIPDEIETDIMPGDIFQIGDHRLLCGDSLMPENWKQLMGGQTAECILTDPPYNVDYQGGTPAKMKIMNDRMSESAFFKFLTQGFSVAAANLRPGGAVYVWHADSEGLNFRAGITEAGLEIKQCLIWVKNSLVMGRQDYQWKHEPCLYCRKPGGTHYFINDRTKTTVIEDVVNYRKMTKQELVKLLEEINSPKEPTTVIHCDKPTRNDLHPTMKPIKLLAPLIQNSTKFRQIVVDGFMGSGSTMVAGHQMGRKVYGMELDPKYAEVVVRRMITLDPDLKITRNEIDETQQWLAKIV